MPLSTQVYKWVPAGGNPAMDKHPVQAGVAVLLVASCYRNWDKLRPDGPLGSYADFTYLKSGLKAKSIDHMFTKLLCSVYYLEMSGGISLLSVNKAWELKQYITFKNCCTDEQILLL